MAEFQKFRSSLGGFNREDVVHYIEYINNKHAAQLNQLKNERDNAYSQYISNVASFWSSYFGIRKTTLYDYITNTDISAEFDKLVK